MNHFKKTAFYDEFPLLNLLGRDRDALKNIQIKRITQDLLTRTPYKNEVIGSLVGICEGEAICLFDAKHNHIGDVKPEHDFKSNYAHEDPWSEDGETVLECIDFLGAADRVHYIVLVRYGYNIVNHHSQPDWSVTIYKPAKDWIIPSHILAAKVKARQEVEAEANF